MTSKASSQRELSEIEREKMLREFAIAGVTDIDAFELNRAGRLAKRQSLRLKNNAKFGGWLIMLFGTTFILFAMLQSENWYQSFVAWVAVAFIVLIQYMVIRTVLLHWRMYLREVSQGFVMAVEGRVTRYKQKDSDGLVTCWCQVDDHQFEVAEAAYYLLKDHIRYRLYYTPDSKILVNLEPVSRE